MVRNMLSEATTDFEKAVLAEIAKIPLGQTRTYGEVAVLAGYPRAARAVGSVCRKNPFPFPPDLEVTLENLLSFDFIPCHRVVASNGIGKYGAGRDGFGVERKKRLLAMEKIALAQGIS